MRLFRSAAANDVPPPSVAPPRPPVVEGWSERELASVYSAAPVRHLKKQDALFLDAEVSASFFVILEGSLQLPSSGMVTPGVRAFSNEGIASRRCPSLRGCSIALRRLSPAVSLRSRPRC